MVKPKGDILIASRCSEGVGSPEYAQILEMAETPAAFIQRVLAKEFFIPDQWCAQEMYQVLLEKDVWIYTEGISHEQVSRRHLRPVASVEACIAALLEKHGRDARWAVVPDGPMLILRLAPSS